MSENVEQMRRRIVEMLEGNMSEPATTDADPKTRATKRRGRPRKRRDTPAKLAETGEASEDGLPSETSAEPHAGDDEG